MSEEFKCPSCGKQIVTVTAQSGEEWQCPHCKKIFFAPGTWRRWGRQRLTRPKEVFYVGVFGVVVSKVLLILLTFAASSVLQPATHSKLADHLHAIILPRIELNDQGLFLLIVGLAGLVAVWLIIHLGLIFRKVWARSLFNLLGFLLVVENLADVALTLRFAVPLEPGIYYNVAIVLYVAVGFLLLNKRHVVTWFYSPPSALMSELDEPPTWNGNAAFWHDPDR